MFKTEEQINARLSSERNLVNRFNNSPAPQVPHEVVNSTPKIHNEVTIIPLEQPGNKEGKQKLSSDAKNEIAIRARLGEKQTGLAEEFNVSQSAIGEIEQGRTKVNEKLVQEKIDSVHDVALDRLMSSLGYITNEKLEKCKATDLSLVASSMSKVIGNIRGKDNDNGAGRVTVQIFAPELKHEASFKTIDV